MKHYYTDDGILYFEGFPDLSRLAKVLDKDNFALDRIKAADAACSLVHDYLTYEAMKGLGGGPTLNEWTEIILDDPFKAACKELFLVWIVTGFVVQEFQLALHQAVCTIQIEWKMGAS